MKFIRALLLLPGLLATVLSGYATTITWNGTISTDWNNATNWLPQQVPLAADHAIINSQTVVIPATAVFSILDINGGTIAGSPRTASGGTINWTAGIVGSGNGSLTVVAGSTLNLSGTATKYLYGALTNAGTVNWSGTGQFYFYNNGTPTYMGGVYNQAGALFDIQNDVIMNTAYTGEFFNNAGTLRKDAGTGTTTFYPQLNNTGLVNVPSGTLLLEGGGSVAGQYTTTNGTVITLAGGSFTASGSPVFSGSGLSTFTGTTLTLLNNAVPGLALNNGSVLLGAAFQGGSITNLTLNGSSLLGTNQLTGVLNWTGGVIGAGNGALTVAVGGTLNMSGTATKYLYGALTNAGTVNWTGTGQFYLYNNGSPTYMGGVYNLASGLFDIQNDATMNNAYTGEFFNNAGTVRKDTATGTTTIDPQFNNTGLVNMLSGTLALGGGGSVDGQFTAASGAAINLGGGSFTAPGSPVFSGSGLSTFTGTLLTLLNNAPAGLALNNGSVLLGAAFQGGSITNLTLNGSSLLGTNRLTGVLNWTGGVIGAGNGALTVMASGTLNMSGTATKYLYGALTNAGTVNWSGIGQFYLYNNGTPTYMGGVYNLASGLFDIQNDVIMNTAYTGEFFNNAGTVRKDAGMGTTTIDPQFNNTGLVSVLSGTLLLEGGGSVAGQYTTTNGTVITLGGGSFTASGSPVFSGSGLSTFTGASLTLLNNTVPGLALNNGNVLLGAAFQGGSITNLTLNGSSLLGTNQLTGVLNWTGGVIGAGNSALTVAVGGTLNMSGTATKYLYGALTNAGTVNWTGTGQFYLYNNGSPTYMGGVYNLASGLFDIQNDATMNNAYTGEFFNNAGTVRKDTATGTTTIDPQFNNTGLVNMLSGTLALGGGGSVDGQFTAASGAAINLGGGSFTAPGSPMFSGSGQSTFTGTSLTLLGNAPSGLALNNGNLLLGPAFEGGSITNLTLNGSTLLGTNRLTGVFNWTGGTVGAGNGALTVMASSTLNMSGTATKYLYGALTNAGTVNWSGTGQFYLYNNGTPTYMGRVYNLASGLFDIQSDATMNNAYTAEVFNNAGTVRKDAGTGTTPVYPQFNNTGLVNVLSGTLALDNGGSVDGQYTTASGAVINLSGGSFTATGSPVFSGSGQGIFTGSLLTLLSNTVPGLALNSGNLALGAAFQGGSITNLTLTGSSLLGTNQLTGVFNWTAGVVGAGNGALTVAVGGTLNMSGAATKYLYGALTNAGTVNWSGAGQFYLYNNGSATYSARVYNLAGGLFDIQNDATMNTAYTSEFFNNAGTVRKDAGASTTTVYPLFNNTGLVEADKATISFQGGFAPANGEVRSGLNSLTDYGKINFSGNAVLGGAVGVAWLNGYVPVTNNSFTIVSFGSHTGIYTNLDLPTKALWATNYTATTFTVTVAASNKLAFIVQPIGGELTNISLPTVVVQIEHPTGDLAASNGVAITLSLANGSGLQGTLTQLTDSSGKATFNDLHFSQIGLKTLLARGVNLTPGTSVTFKIVPAFGVEWLTGKAQVDLNATNNFGAVVISASTNLMTWTPLFTNQVATNAIQFVDPASPNYSHRFYRLGP